MCAYHPAAVDRATARPLSQMTKHVRVLAIAFGLFFGLLIVAALLEPKKPPPQPQAPKVETRNEHCQTFLTALQIGGDFKSMSPLEKVHWCEAHGYGWDPYEPPSEKHDNRRSGKPQ